MAIRRSRRLAVAGLVAALLLSAPAAAQQPELRWTDTVGDDRRIEFRVLNASDTGRPKPAIVLLGGLERGAAALDLLPDDDTVVLAGFDYPVEVPRRVRWQQIPPLLSAVEQGIDDTRHALQRLHERLAAHPGVDAERIGVIGVSLGAPFALLAAADSPYAGLVLVHGFADVPATMRHQFARRWREPYGRFGELAAWGVQGLLSALIEYPDPRQAIPRLRPGQPVLSIAAEDDEFVPPAVNAALIRALRASPARLTVRQSAGGHVRGDQAERIQALFALAQPWLRRHGFLEARAQRSTR